jgi:hypothetical protein
MGLEKILQQLPTPANYLPYRHVIVAIGCSMLSHESRRQRNGVAQRRQPAGKGAEGEYVRTEDGPEDREIIPRRHQVYC